MVTALLLLTILALAAYVWHLWSENETLEANLSASNSEIHCASSSLRMALGLSPYDSTSFTKLVSDAAEEVHVLKVLRTDVRDLEKGHSKTLKAFGSTWQRLPQRNSAGVFHSPNGAAKPRKKQR